MDYELKNKMVMCKRDDVRGAVKKAFMNFADGQKNNPKEKKSFDINHLLSLLQDEIDGIEYFEVIHTFNKGEQFLQ